MTGMKEGAGEDPFSDDSVRSEDDGTKSTGGDAVSGQTEEADSREDSPRQVDIPYKFRRDGVQDNRTRVPLFLHEETKRAEREAQRELEERFDNDIALTDLREALVKAGLENLENVEGQLEKWGYGVQFND